MAPLVSPHPPDRPPSRYLPFSPCLARWILRCRIPCLRSSTPPQCRPLYPGHASRAQPRSFLWASSSLVLPLGLYLLRGDCPGAWAGRLAASLGEHPSSLGDRSTPLPLPVRAVRVQAYRESLALPACAPSVGGLCPAVGPPARPVPRGPARPGGRGHHRGGRPCEHGATAGRC